MPQKYASYAQVGASYPPLLCFLEKLWQSLTIPLSAFDTAASCELSYVFRRLKGGAVYAQLCRLSRTLLVCVEHPSKQVGFAALISAPTSNTSFFASFLPLFPTPLPRILSNDGMMAPLLENVRRIACVQTYYLVYAGAMRGGGGIPMVAYDTVPDPLNSASQEVIPGWSCAPGFR